MGHKVQMLTPSAAHRALVFLLALTGLIQGLDYLRDDEEFNMFQTRYRLDAQSEALLLSLARKDHIIFVLDDLSHQSLLFTETLNSTRDTLQKAFPTMSFEIFDISQAERTLSFATFTETPCVCISRLAVYKCLCSDEAPDMSAQTIGKFVLEFYCDPRLMLNRFPKDMDRKNRPAAKLLAYYDQETRGGLLATGLKLLQCKYDGLIDLVQMSSRASMSEVFASADLFLKEKDQAFFIRYYDSGVLVYSGSNFTYYLEKVVIDLMFPPFYTLNNAAWEMYVRGCFRRMLIYFHGDEDDRVRRDLQLLTEGGLYMYFQTKYEIFIAPTEGDYYFNQHKFEELGLPYLPMLVLLDAEEGEERWYVYPYGELTVAKILTFIAEYEHDQIPRHFKSSPPPPMSVMQESIESAMTGNTTKKGTLPEKVIVHELVGAEFREKVLMKMGKLVFVLLYGYEMQTSKANFEAAVQPLRHLPNSSFYQFNLEKEEIPYYHFERFAGSVLVAIPFNDSVHVISGTSGMTTRSLLLGLKKLLPS